MNALIPTLAILASALKIEHLTDGATQRAADNALNHLATAPIYEFNGSELTIWSQSTAGTQYVTDGISCTCKAAKHAICKHRALFRLLLAREILLDPGYVRAKVLEQVAPADHFDGDPGLPAGAGDVPPPCDAPPAVLIFTSMEMSEDDWYIR